MLNSGFKKGIICICASGFEQSTRYVIMDANGNHVGYMAEQETGVGGMLSRSWTRSHRSFTMYVFDRDQKEVLRVSCASTTIVYALG